MIRICRMIENINTNAQLPKPTPCYISYIKSSNISHKTSLHHAHSNHKATKPTMQSPTSARTLPMFRASLLAAPVKAGAPPPVLVFVGEPTGVGELRNVVAVEVVTVPTVDVAVAVLVAVEFVALAVSTFDKEDKKLEISATVELTPLLRELETLLAVEFAVVVNAVTVEVGLTVDVVVVGLVEEDDEGEADEEDEEDVVVVVVVVASPEETTEVVVETIVDSGKVGRNVVVKPSVTTTVDCAEAAVKSAATARMFLREGILLV